MKDELEQMKIRIGSLMKKVAEDDVLPDDVRESLWKSLDKAHDQLLGAIQHFSPYFEIVPRRNSADYTWTKADQKQIAALTKKLDSFIKRTGKKDHD